MKDINYEVLSLTLSQGTGNRLENSNDVHCDPDWL